jgi:hypothetical protein
MKVDERIMPIIEQNRQEFGDEVINTAIEKFKTIPKSIGCYKKEEVVIAVLYQTIREMKDPFISLNDIKGVSCNKQHLKKAAKIVTKLFKNNTIDYSKYLGIDLKELQKQFSTNHPRSLAILGLYLKGCDYQEIGEITHASYCHVITILKKFLGENYGVYNNTQKCEKTTLDVGLATC